MDKIIGPATSNMIDILTTEIYKERNRKKKKVVNVAGH